MSKLTKQSFSIFIPLLVVVLFVIVPRLAHANSPTWPPVPTYSPVNTFTENPTATVPADLITKWRGIYTLPTYSVVENTYPPTLRELISNSHSISLPKNKRTYKFSPAQVYAWTGTLSSSIDSKPTDPVMKIENDRVVDFTAPQTGRTLDRYHTTLKIIDALQEGKNTIPLDVAQTVPNKGLGELNSLGIKELIGRGESKFSGSPANRRWNIRVGVSKMTGIIVKPGEDFSFNKYLGPVEASTGFKPELVIKQTGTVPEFGGGLCQVSSTTFRAAMHAGLPILARRNHSYAVQYYAPQGTDATIYPGVQDLKFTNDTGNSILIWPYFKDDNYLVFDFYGTFDNRKVELGTPVQFDRQANGAMKAYWTRTVTMPNGEQKNDKFSSVYQPPALFHKEETFVSTNGTQTAPNGQVTPPPTPPTNTNSNTNSNTNTNTNTPST